jgi:hypothetical protein
MLQIFGDYVEQERDQEYLVIQFSPTTLPLQQRWRNSGLSADFLADYWTTFLPARDVPSPERQQEIRGAINYIANELLENTMKFSHKPAHHPVTLGLYLYQGAFRFYASNFIDPQAVEAFQARIQDMLTQEPIELYMRQLEINAADETGGVSCLGLLTMLNDYDARLAWKFQARPHDPEGIMVTTMVQLTL